MANDSNKKEGVEMELNLLVMKIGVYSKAYELECESQRSYISSFLCPRCGDCYLPGDVVLAARSNLSALDLDIHICNECALPDKASTSLDDFKLWAIADSEFGN